MMLYTKNNMEPVPSSVHDRLHAELNHALDSKNPAAVADQVERFTHDTSVTADWLEAIGVRYQIRDFMVNQKANLAAMNSVGSKDVGQTISLYLQNFDNDLEGIVLGDTTGIVDPEQRKLTNKANRISRVATELRGNSADNTVSLLGDFSAQGASKVLFADALLNLTIDARNGITERLWPVAQTYNESGTDLAQQELAEEALAANDSFDKLIQSSLRWREVE
jgi:hypothetical protein